METADELYQAALLKQQTDSAPLQQPPGVQPTAIWRPVKETPGTPPSAFGAGCPPRRLESWAAHASCLESILFSKVDFICKTNGTIVFKLWAKMQELQLHTAGFTADILLSTALIQSAWESFIK